MRDSMGEFAYSTLLEYSTAQYLKGLQSSIDVISGGIVQLVGAVAVSLHGVETSIYCAFVLCIQIQYIKRMFIENAVWCNFVVCKLIVQYMYSTCIVL